MRGRVRFGVFLAVGLVIAGLLALFVSPHASSKPDGLEKVAADQGIDGQARDHTLDDGPAAGYTLEAVDDGGLSTGLAGLLGVTVVFAAAGGLFLVVRRTSGRGRDGGSAPSTARASEPADA